MREMVLRGGSKFLVLGVVLSLCSATPMGGGAAAGGIPVRIAAGDMETFVLEGTVTDAPDFLPALDALEAAKPGSEEHLYASLEKVFTERHPAADVVVTLNGRSVTKKTRTDAEGNFSFSGLPEGEYLVSAEAPSRPTPVKGVTRTATATREFTVGRNAWKANLELSTIRPVIRGRITERGGKPIPGAKVTAILDVHHVVFDGWLQTHDAPTWSTVSNEDGTYELRGMDSMNWYHLAGALTGGKALREFVDIHVEADGYVQVEENTLEVPLATEDVIILARRLLGIFNQLARRNGTEVHPEKEVLSLPASEGNVITGIDIVLERAGSDTGEEG